MWRIASKKMNGGRDICLEIGRNSEFAFYMSQLCGFVNLLCQDILKWIYSTWSVAKQSKLKRRCHSCVLLKPTTCDTISYSLFAVGDTGIYPHAASQYHARPKASRGIAMLSVDKFPHPWKQTAGNEFIPCSNDVCHILKRFRSFKTPATTFIVPKSSYKLSGARSHRNGKGSGRRPWSPLWRHRWRSFRFISHADDVKRYIRVYSSQLLANQKRESAPSMG